MLLQQDLLPRIEWGDGEIGWSIRVELDTFLYMYVCVEGGGGGGVGVCGCVCVCVCMHACMHALVEYVKHM